MGDIRCAKCGEPWDAYGARHGGDMTSGEYDRFLQGKGCPACHFGQDAKGSLKRTDAFLFDLLEECDDEAALSRLAW